MEESEVSTGWGGAWCAYGQMSREHDADFYEAARRRRAAALERGEDPFADFQDMVSDGTDRRKKNGAAGSSRLERAWRRVMEGEAEAEAERAGGNRGYDGVGDYDDDNSNLHVGSGSSSRARSPAPSTMTTGPAAGAGRAGGGITGRYKRLDDDEDDGGGEGVAAGKKRGALRRLFSRRKVGEEDGTGP
ncbi:hypothetical protein GGR56DRAFT_425369 [Xylariaceae sp. FL0804]|nr:hypothetical protein GGR56DRAFT_425369 [Xylariaceae sp. FL0804]